MIKYPLYDLNIQNKKYDLSGLINLNSENYTAIIKDKNNKWIKYDENNKIYEIEENKVMNSNNAYILFYISKESPYNFDYIKMMKSLTNNIEISNKNNEEFIIKNDMNYFRYEPVIIDMNTKNNIGYIMEENIDNKNEIIIHDYHKNFVRVKLEFCDGWIHKSRVKKIVNLESKKKNK